MKGWIRVCPGLYVDKDDRWVISRDDHQFYTVRVLLGWGPTTEGKLFPDYGSIEYGAYFTLADAKAGVESWGDRYPTNDSDIVAYRIWTEYKDATGIATEIAVPSA